jgi:hypothetical protein
MSAQMPTAQMERNYTAVLAGVACLHYTPHCAGSYTWVTDCTGINKQTCCSTTVKRNMGLWNLYTPAVIYKALPVAHVKALPGLGAPTWLLLAVLTHDV